jgi:hypothetical protein
MEGGYEIIARVQDRLFFRQPVEMLQPRRSDKYSVAR